VSESGRRADRAVRVSEPAGRDVRAEVAMVCGNVALFQGRLDEATGWYRRARDAATAAADPAERVVAVSTEILALAYGGDPTAGYLANDVLSEVGKGPTPYAAYAWYCAGEADLSVDVERARARLDRALELAEATGASFVAGVAGASRVSLDARAGDPLAAACEYRRLITQWRRAGMWSTQWTMLRSIAGLLARLGRAHDAAVLTGAVRTTTAGHRVFGADDLALIELASRLREVLGDDGYEAAYREGAVLDGDAAVEHALRALSSTPERVTSAVAR
jgi:tetratricopeptide (TPR) repeat protein